MASRAGQRVRVVGGGVDEAFFTPASDRDSLRGALYPSLDGPLLVSARRLVDARDWASTRYSEAMRTFASRDAWRGWW